MAYLPLSVTFLLVRLVS